MSTPNPYAFDPASSFAVPEQGSGDDATGLILRALIETRPWVRFMGILAAIGAVLIGFGSCVAIPMMANGRAGVGIAVGILVVYLGLAVVYGFAAKFLLSYGTAISRAETTHSLNDVADALVQQKRFWKLVGISTAIGLVFYVLFIVLAIGGGILMRGL